MKTGAKGIAKIWNQPNVHQLMNGKTKYSTSIQWNIVKLFKKWGSDACYNMEENWKYYTKWEKPDVKHHKLYDSTYIKFPEQAHS